MQLYTEALELCQRIGDRRAEATAVFNLGHAYARVPALRDLGRAEYWYRHYLELLDQGDILGRARGASQIGSVAYERFKDARAGGAPQEEALAYLNNAVDARNQALDLLPDDAVSNLAVNHHGLGNLYGAAGDTGKALGHYQQAIQYREREGDRYLAGWAQHDAALALANGSRRHDALLYAQAALRDFEAVGLGAAHSPTEHVSSSPNSNRS